MYLLSEWKRLGEKFNLIAGRLFPFFGSEIGRMETTEAIAKQDAKHQKVPVALDHDFTCPSR